MCVCVCACSRVPCASSRGPAKCRRLLRSPGSGRDSAVERFLEVPDCIRSAFVVSVCLIPVALSQDYASSSSSSYVPQPSEAIASPASDCEWQLPKPKPLTNRMIPGTLQMLEARVERLAGSCLRRGRYAGKTRQGLQ